MNIKFQAALLVVISSFVWSDYSEVNAQMDNSAFATEFFLDSPPPKTDLSKLPSSITDVVVAKVRIVGDIFARGRRDQSGVPPSPPKYIADAELEIADVLSGKAVRGARYDVSFAASGTGFNYKFPNTPKMKAREYFVVFYRDTSGVRTLLGFPISQENFKQWEKESLEYQRIRSRPGTRQP
jgi:hypothetical protein